MARQTLACSSCKKNVSNARGTTVFKCPNCSKRELIRCMHCRETAAKYVCADCNFEGPN